ncbi:MAG: hypothetical protein ACRDSK_32055 [Actinophytocola sp.]|uniref:hypothetical protein n=1 Tax=Actinophytocola sp. TaxID=1872138 RepID=UPI003D6A9130
MNPETEIATQPTVREPVVTAPVEPPVAAGTSGAEPADPLAAITLRPRAFASVLAVAGLLLGLILALVPVHVAGLDDAEQTSVSCGNTIGGVETPLLAEGLGSADDAVLATYVGTCQQAISTRLLFAWPMFFAGMLGIVWLGVVRREPERLRSE